MITPGKTVISGKYAVLEPLGKGGMGEVFKVRHTSFQDQFAIKTLLPRYAEEEALITRFKEEARKNHSLSNPQNSDQNIVQVIDVDFDPALNLHYYVMEYIEGKTLNQILREQGTLPLPDVFEIAEKVGRALAKAHNLPKPMIHRDISPSNIMIEDRSRRVVVMDFGIAKEVGEEGGTRPDVVIGKPKYCSPEQMRHKPLDGAADIYSLGIVVYELYTGKQFFAGLTADKVIEQVLYDPTENIPHFDPPAPKEFVTLVTRAIAKSRAQRYPRMEEFLQAVERCRSSLPEETGETTIFIQPSANKREDTEERRRKLEEELRLLSLDFQGRARTAREQAEEEGAAVLAAELFQQGQAKEAEASRLLEDRNHSRAQESYGEAVALFTRTSAAAQQAAEQAYKEMEAVKAEAERYRARTTQAARHFYTDGLMAEGQAREFLEDKRYQPASEKCAAARRAFADARDVAQESLRGEAAAARQQAAAVRDAAREEGAERLAAELFHQAEQREQQAAAALAQEEFTHALQLYATARQQYGEARQQAHTEQHRQRALTAQQQAQAARQHLEAQEQDYTALPASGLAAEAQRQGDARFAAQEYEEAVGAYEQARQGYEQAGQQARQLQRQRATRASQHLQELREQAAKAGSQERFAQQWTEADQLVARGVEREDREDFPHAQQWYEHAAQRFEQVRRAAEAQAARERAEAAAREQAEATRQQINKCKLELQPLAQWWGPTQAQAEEQERTAEERWGKEPYEQTAEQYAAVLKVYEEALREAQATRRAYNVAAEIRKEAEQARQAAEDAQAGQYDAILFEQAVSLYTKGESQFKAKDWTTATATFTQARELFGQARQHAEEAKAQARRAAEEAYEKALKAQQDAAEAEQLFPPRWQDVVVRLQRARDALGVEQYAIAQDGFTQSAALFHQLAQDVQDHKHREELKEKAEAAKREAQAAGQQALGDQADQFAAAALSRAEERFQQADTAFLTDHFTQAQTLFAEARQLYGEAQLQAQQARHHKAALTAKEQAEDVQRQAISTGAPELARASYEQADSAYQRGNEHFAAKAYEQAVQQYTRTREGFARARREAEQERRRWETVAKEQAEASRQQIAQVKEQLQSLEQWWGQTKAQAEQQETAAERKWEARQYEQAAKRYEQVKRAYEAALREAQATQRAYQSAAAARTQAEQARQAAVAAQAPQDAAALFERAVPLQAQGEQQFQEKAWEAAASTFPQARDLFAQAQQQARTAKEQARQDAAAARKRTTEARTQAEQVDAPKRFSQEFAQAQQMTAQGQTCEEQQEFAQALSFYEQATQRFVKLQQEAVLQAARERAEKERLRVTEAKPLPETLKQWTDKNEKWQDAQRLEAAAERAWQGGEYAQAEEQYRQAAQLYTLARGEAETAQHRYQALRAKEQAAREQTSAYDAGAQQYATSLYEQAIENQQQGEQSLTAQQWAQAEATFRQAQQFFIQARENAQRTKARQLAAEARAKVLQAQQDAAEGAALFPKETTEASDVLLDANRAFAREAFTAAEKGFAQSAELFQRIQRAVILHRQKEQAEHAQARARELHSKTLAATGRRKRRANRALSEGDRLFGQGKYAEAQAKYEEAVSLFATLQLRGPQQLPSPYRAYLRYGSVLVLAVGLGFIGFRFMTSSPRPTPEPQLRITRATPEPAEEITIAEGQNQNFAVDTESSQKAPLHYVWLLDGKEQAEGKTWTYQPGFDEGGAKPKEVKVVVSDLNNLKDERTWQIQVRDVNRPPAITSVSPEPEVVVEVAPNEVKEFSIDASDPDHNDRLAYSWFLDGQEVSKERRWQFRASSSEKTQHTVMAEVSDNQENGKVQVAWNISVKTLPPLQITQAIPLEQELKVAEGERLPFSFEVTGQRQDSLRYTWLLDGKKKAEGKEWTYLPDFSEGEEKTKEVKAVVTGSENRRIEKVWHVQVQNVDRPPTITVFSPRTNSVEITDGDSPEFSITAADPDRDDRLVYIWSVDGQKVAQGERPQFRASSSRSSYQVAVEVLDTEGQKDRVAWNVTVKEPSLPPRITGAQPQSEKVSAKSGEPLDFSVNAELPGGEKKNLRYQWSVNGAAPQTTETERFRFGETAPGTYQLTVVAVSPKGLQSTPRKWTVEVQPRGNTLQLSEEEVKAWLEAFQQAFAKKDVNELVKLGAVDSKNSQQLATTLDSDKNFSIELKNPIIKIEGNKATVTYTRIDTMKGSKVPPSTIMDTLQKEPDGRIVRLQTIKVK